MKHRYPGPRAFTGDDRHLFFGRESETQELFRLVVLNDIVVLFGESGTGKTSLLQAGVCPGLEERLYKPVFIRLNNPAEAPELQVCRQLKEGGYIPADISENLTLWEYFGHFWHVDLGEVYTPIFIFDQFEELFTLYRSEERRTFIIQFAAVANGQAPAGLPPEIAAPPKAKFVFGIRSDFLYLLDDLSADIPAILRCRFQLRRLNRERATEAITRPAGMDGDFASTRFKYSDEALNIMLETLGRHDADDALQADTISEELEIAAVQLQQVCQHLEAAIIEKKCSPDFEITPEFYGGAKGIQHIIDEFYNAVLDKLPDDQREAVEKLLARGLLRNGRCIMMEASAILSDFGVSQSSLNLLHVERLLNCEARKGELYYEISHDTLIDPVLERFKKIEEAEKEAATQREREELDKAKQQAGYERGLRRKAEVNEKRAKERTRLAYLLSGVAIFLALVTGFLAYESNKRQKALEQANILIEQKRLDAEQALARALEEERQRKETQINAFLAKANQLLTFGATRAAIENLENALKVDSTREDIRQQLKELNTRQ